MIQFPEPDLEQFALSLFEIGAVRLGQFQLHSGRTSPIYLDLRMLVSHPETLRMAMLSAEPQICDIDAIVRDPSTRAEQRIQYTRLTLPITNASGAAETLSTPFVDHRIDLRAHPASLIQ